MNARSTRPCPSCSELELGRDPLCSLCWPQVPAKDRKRLLDATRKLGYNPASAAVQAEYQYALTVAMRSVA